MYYGIYKNVRDCSWKCFIDFNVCSLPVDILSIARAAGIKVIKNSAVNDLAPGEFGKAYFDGERWFIIYDDTQSTEQSRFTIAHELGHIFLGHALTHTKYANVQEFGKRSPAESQANKFAVRLLCPACVLMAIEACEASEIAKVCKVPLPIAEKRAERMKELLVRNKFFTDPLEKQVFDNFKDYIEQIGSDKR